MRLTIACLFCLAGLIFCDPIDFSKNNVTQKGKYMEVSLNETSGVELMEKWLSQAVSGLMAAVASKRLNEMDSDAREDVHTCSKAASSIPEHARCIVRVLDATNGKVNKTAVLVKDTPTNNLKGKVVKSKDVEWIGSFGTARSKRDSGFKVVNKDSYTLKTDADETVATKLARKLTKTVRAIKNKEGAGENWRDAIEKVKKLGETAKEEKKRRNRMKERLREMVDNTPPEFVDPRKPIALKQQEMEDQNEKKQTLLRKEKTEEIRVPLKLMRDAVKLAMQLGGQNVSDFDQKTIKMASPRLMSILPEQEDDSLINLLSPSLFSLHENGTGIEKLTSLPHLLKKLDNQDQEAWLDFIVETSGVSDSVDKTETEFQKKRDEEMRGTGGVPLYFNKENATEIGGDVEKRKIEVFESLDKSYNEKQRAELDTQGYSFLTKEQLHNVYGKEDSPYKNRKVLKRLQRRLRDDPEKFIEHDIRALAEAEKFHMDRRRDIVSSPFILTPLTGASAALSHTFVVLSPLVLSPITLSPAVLGPIILSPWVFVPLVLSPRVLSPLIVNPLIFSPIVLSPLVLHPLILVPGVFNPLVLSPLVLSPLILSPQVFSPLILTPFVLNPLILTPMVGSPLVLSPFALSPIIASPQALFAVVLSPYALSPLIESKLIAAEVVLSPSWLS